MSACNTKNKCCDKSATYSQGDILLCSAHSKLKHSNKCKKIKSDNSVYNIGKKMVEELDKYPDFFM